MVNILQYQSWGIINEIYPNIFSYYFFVEQLFFEFNTERLIESKNESSDQNPPNY